MKAKKENYPGHRITELYCMVAIDKDGDEGLPALYSPDGPVPAVGTTKKSLSKFIEAARRELQSEGVKIKILKFSNPEVVDLP